MRLICPNCGAQYEVDARVIPDTGRDVQCSNCGHTWFQGPPEQDVELASELGYEVPQADLAEPSASSVAPSYPQFEDSDTPVAPEISDTEPDEAMPQGVAQADPQQVNTQRTDTRPPKPDVETEVPSEQGADQNPEQAAEQNSVPATPTVDIAPEEPFTQSDTAPEPLSEGEEDEASVAPVFAAAAASSTVKDSVRDILRAEVEFDHTMRGAAGDQIETQPDLGLEEPDQAPAKKSLRDRMARLRGLDPSDPGIPVGSAAATSGKRRDLLPDIEEINSTLSASSERDEDGTVPDEETRKARAERSGFRTGFFLLVLLAAILVALYVFAPLLAEKIPALAPILETYVGIANGFRLWLDQLLSGASARLNALLSQLNG